MATTPSLNAVNVGMVLFPNLTSLGLPIEGIGILVALEKRCGKVIRSSGASAQR
jgi:hypothetical protein